MSIFSVNKILLFFIFIVFNVHGQNKRNYQEEYKTVTLSTSDEKVRNSKQKDYFNSLQSHELISALSEISKMGDANFIAYDLFSPIVNKFADKEFRKQILGELTKDSNSTDYKIVLIDFLKKNSRGFPEEANTVSDIYFSIAKNKNIDSRLRQIAASKVAVTANHSEDKAKVKELVLTNDIPAINGAAKAIKGFVRSKALENEVEEWVDVLINSLEKNKTHIKELNVPIATLGYTNSKKARTYLLDLFTEHVKSDTKFSESIVYSLSNNADNEVINKIVSEYRRNKEFNNFGSELTLMTVTNNNVKLIDQLFESDSEEEKINYLRSVKYLKEPADKNAIIANCKSLLNSSSEEIRLEAVKTLRFLLSGEEEQIVFREHLNKENSLRIKNEIYTYIGR